MLDLKRLAVACALIAAALVLPKSGSRVADAAQPPRPLLECADVNADTAVSAGDIGTIVAKYGRIAGQPGYHPMYEVGAVDGAIAAGDIGGVVADYGLNCAAGRPDTQIARATLWVLTKHPELLTEDPDVLNGLGYLRFSQELPNQGAHYIQPPATWDGAFDPAQPEGLVYRAGKLAAQLYYVEGDDIGWGPETAPEGGVDIDSICGPAPCSWTGGADRWHFHSTFCMLNVGTPQATTQLASSTTECEKLHDATGFGGTWYWDERVGWMGHLWSHVLNPAINPLDAQGNGRFADDFATP